MSTPKIRVAGSIVGKSAYEIAVDNGFVGSEEEWLASLYASEKYLKTTYDPLEENLTFELVMGKE